MAAASTAYRLLLLLIAASLLAFSPAAARPCGQTLFVSFSADSNTHSDHPIALTTTVVTVFHIRRLGPEPLVASLQIGRPEPLPPASASASSVQERAMDTLVVVAGLLFGLSCGALTAASMYLVWSLLVHPSPYDDDVFSDEDEESDTESPKEAGYVTILDTESLKRAGYVTIPDTDAYAGGKN